MVRKILAHLGLPAEATELAPARLPKELSFDFEPDLQPASEAQDTEPSWADVSSCRAPPNGDFDL